MVEPALFALTSTPSIAPSSAEPTLPASAACAAASMEIAASARLKTAAATSECLPKRMSASRKCFEKARVKSYYKSPRRRSPIRSTPGGRHGPAEIDWLDRPRAQGARGIQELRSQGQRDRPRGGRDH